ncbi:SMC family ATPase [bacterium]|nr:SMC family ATPase [bacterium]
MKLTRIRLLNFRQHADTTIEFERGLTGIIGPNGAGKSTILEAVAWALYGGDTARGGKDTIRFVRAPARAQVRVELEFELGGHQYRVVRGLTMAELYLDGGADAIANSATAVGDVLQRRLGMSRSEFFNTYFTGQKELTVMASLTATERGQFLSRVLGYEKLRAAQELVEMRRRDLRSTIAGMRLGMPDAATIAKQELDAQAALADAHGRLASAELERATAQSAFDAIAPRWTEAQQLRDLQQTLDADLRVTESQLAEQGRNAARVAAELQKIREARTALEPMLVQLEGFAAIEQQLGAVKALQAKHLQRETMSGQESELRADLATARQERDRYSTAPILEEETTLLIEAKFKELEAAHGLLELRRTEWVRDRQEAETKRNALRAQYADLRDQRERLVNLGEQGTCPTCQRPLLDHYRQVLDLLDTQLETVQTDGNYFRSRLDQLEEMPADVAAAVSAQANRLAGQVEREAAFTREEAGVARQLSELVTRREDIVRRRQDVPGTEEEFVAIRDTFQAADSALRVSALRTVSVQGEAKGASDTLARATQARAELQAIEAQLAERENEKRLHDELHRAYSDLRNDLNLQLRPELSELASAFLTELTDARYTEVELDDKYRIVVLEDGVPKPVISGGEEDLANLVLRLAISQMIAERAGQSFSLLVLDEIFGSLDDTRRHNVVELLRGLQDRFEQVILITHIEGVRDGLDQVIEVNFDANSGAATVRGGASAPAGVEVP